MKRVHKGPRGPRGPMSKSSKIKNGDFEIFKKDLVDLHGSLWTVKGMMCNIIGGGYRYVVPIS